MAIIRALTRTIAALPALIFALGIAGAAAAANVLAAWNVAG